jgi:hypothetical protein
MATEPKRLSEYGDFDNFGTSISADDVENDELTVLGVMFVNGKMGEYAFITCQNENADKMSVRCGGTLILDALHKAYNDHAFPLQMKLVKRGRAWIAE